MYKPENNNTHYFLIVIATASLIAWAFFTYYKPIIIEASCSDIAEGSSGLYAKRKEIYDPRFTYENLKVRCIEEASVVAKVN